MATTPTENQLARLPKWAQDRLALLEMRLREASRTITEMAGTDPRPPVAVRDAYKDTPIPVAWDWSDEIVFYPQPGDEHTWLSFRLARPGQRQEVIEVMSSGTLTLEPKTSNHILLSTTGF